MGGGWRRRSRRAEPSEEGAKRPRGRRILRRVVFSVLGFIGVVLLLVALAVGYALTNSGNERLRSILVSQVNHTIRGELAVGKLLFRGNHLVLEDVQLQDPDGEPVAQIERVEVWLRLSALLHKTLELKSVEVERPVLLVVQDPDGTNLQRAIQPVRPKEEKPKEEKQGGFSVLLNRLSLRDGSIDFEQRTAEALKSYRIDDLSAEGNAKVLDGGDRLDGALTLGGLFSEPLEGPFKVELKAHGEGEARNVDLSLDAPGAMLSANASMNGEDELDAIVKSLKLEPSFVRAFVPKWPLQASVKANAELHKRGDEAKANLVATAGSGKLELNADAQVETKEVRSLEAQLSNLDLSELIPDGPKSDVALSLKAHGGGSSLEDLHGEVRLTAPRSTMSNQPFGPIDVHALAKNGVVSVEKLFAQVPGVELHGHGEAGREKLDLVIGMVAKDLDAFSRTLGVLAGPQKLKLAGNGQATVAATGPAKDPALHLEASFPRLVVGTRKINDLSVNALLPRMKDPLSLEAKAHAGFISMGKKGFNDVRAEVNHHGDQLSVDASARGLATLSLGARATVAPNHKRLTLTALQLSWPEATWKLEKAAELRFDETELSTTPLALSAGDQRIAVQGWKRGDSLNAHLDVSRFDLGKLPRWVLNPMLNLGGLLSVKIDAKGKLARPEVEAHVDLKRGRYKLIDGLTLSSDAQYVRDRVTGTLHASGVAKLDAEFDVPLRALKQRRREPIRVTATVAQVDLERLVKSGIKVPATGVLSAELTVRGYASDPKLNFALKAKQLVYQQLPPTDVNFVVRSGQDSHLMARMDLTTVERKKGWAEVETPWSVARLIARPPSSNDVLHAPLHLTADFKEFPLPLPYAADLSEELVMGTVTLNADVRGPLLAPRGKLHAFFDGVARGHSPVVEATVDAEALPSGIALSATAVRQKDKQRIVSLEAKLKAQVAKLRNPKALASLPVEVDGVLGPVPADDVRQLLTPPKQAGAHVGLRIRQAPLTGTISGTLEGRGTLGDPKLTLRADAKGLGTSDTKPGDVQLAYDYANAAHELKVQLKSQNGGQLAINGHAKADVSLGGIQRGLDVPAIPITAALTASQFDPQFLAGVSPKVRQLGGLIDASANVTGTPTLPKVQGRMEWKDGLLSVAGNGRYEGIHLLVEGNNRRVEVKELTAKSSDGDAKIYALAEDQGDGRFKLQAKVDMNDFPIISLDQLVANVTARAELNGLATRRSLEVSRLHIPEAHVQLPDVKRKNLQPLDEPKDVVFTKRGKPIEDGKKKAEAQRGTGGSGTPSTFRVTAKVYAPRNIWIKAKDINAEVGFSDGFQVLWEAAPQLFGDVTVQRGRLTVFGKKFDLDRDSKLTFTGPPIEPTLDVTAVHNNEREGVKVFLKVSGPTKKLEVKPTSEPPLSETEIYTLIATGRRNLRPGAGGTTSSTGAASIVGSFAASQLKKTLSNALPLDVLSIEAGDSGIEGTKVEAGTYVNDKLYIGYTGRVGANPQRGENSNAVRVEYSLTRRWSFQAEYGDARAGGADLIWSKEY